MIGIFHSSTNSNGKSITSMRRKLLVLTLLMLLILNILNIINFVKSIEQEEQRASLKERKLKFANSNVKNLNKLNNDQINNRNIKIKSSKNQFTKPFTKFIQWKHCYEEEEENSLISLITSHLTIVPTSYNTPGVKIEMDIKFNEPIMETNYLFYNLELWHEETGQKIKYKGPYDICCGYFLGNESKNNLEYNCELQDSNCPITNLNKTYHVTIQRPLYSIENGTHEATLRIFKHQPLEHDPQRKEMIDQLCLDIPFKILLPSNSNSNNGENNGNSNNNNNNGENNNVEWKLSDHTNSIVELKDEL